MAVNILNASKIKINGVYTDEKGIYPKGRYEVPTAEEDIEQIEIRGRDGELTKKHGYKNIPLSVTFYIKEDSFKTAFRKAKSFLLSAKTIQVDDDNEVYYKVKSVKVNSSENPMKTFGEFVVNFTLDPFMYELDNEPINIRKETTIINEGHDSLPIITVSAFGTGKVYINNQVVTIKDVNGNIIVDSEMQNAYREGSPPINMNKHMIGGFPVLEHGSNIVSFSGSINWIEIICNRRWL